MKKVLTAVSLAALLVSFEATAQSSIEQDLSSICEIVSADDKSQLRRKLNKVKSKHSLKFADYYDGITCGNNSLMMYADNNGSLDVLELMTKKVSRVMAAKELESWSGSAIGRGLLEERVH